MYRILRAFDLVSRPVFMMVSAKDKYEKPTGRVNELWQTEITDLKVQYWGWNNLLTVLNDYSRYILDWKLSWTMAKGMYITAWTWHWPRPTWSRARSNIIHNGYQIMVPAMSPIS